MDSLPDALVQSILANLRNARDIASCNCVSRYFLHATPFTPRLYFPRNSFDNVEPHAAIDPDSVISKLVSHAHFLEELVVYCPFSAGGLREWLTARDLQRLELRMDTLSEKGSGNLTAVESSCSSSMKLDCIDLVRTSLESLKLWGVLMNQSPKWGVFEKLSVLEIVGCKLKDEALSDAIRACPNLTSLSLLGCDGVRFVSFDLKELVQCRLDIYGAGNCSLYLNAPKIRQLEVQGCSFIQVNQMNSLKSLSISNTAGRVYKVDLGTLSSVEFLSMRGVQWCWEAISTVLQSANEVKELVMKIEFTGDYDKLQPFLEIDLVDFFNAHPKLRRFEIHGAMFAALCQKNSLRNVGTSFMIPSLEEVLVTVRSPLNAEQKMNTLESLLKYGKNIRRMGIRILQMKNSHSSADDFFEEICKFRYMNQKKVFIE